MGVNARLTNDKQVLYTAIAPIMFIPGVNQFDGAMMAPQMNDGRPRYYSEADDRAYAAAQAPYFTRGSAMSLGRAVIALRDMPGRRAVVLFSAGFAGATGPIVETAHRSSVVIYTIDMRALSQQWAGRRIGPEEDSGSGGLWICWRTAQAGSSITRAMPIAHLWPRRWTT
jgi:hypothetical protein